MSESQDVLDGTTYTSDDVFEIKLFARVVQGAEGTFIVTTEPPKGDAPGVAVRTISNLDVGDSVGGRVGAALLREHAEFYADTSHTLHSTVLAVNGDGTTVSIPVPPSRGVRPSEDVTSTAREHSLLADNDDATTEGLGLEGE
jgi:hypothetical protein